MNESSVSSVAEILMTLGGLFLFGLLADVVGRRTPLPRVTMLLITGFVLGSGALDVLPAFMYEWSPVLTNIALAMIGFLLGGRLSVAGLKEAAAGVLGMSLGVVMTCAVLITVVLAAAGVPLELALLLAGIASATAPAATIDVVREVRARGPFSRMLLEIVAIDDAWGLLIFTLMLAVAQYATGGAGLDASLIEGLRELGGSVLLGVVIGVPMAYLTGRVRRGEPSQAEALGMVLLTAGLSEYFHVSYLLTCIVLGSVVANLARHHQRPFHAIEGIEWPFLILFFLLAGASLHLPALANAGWLLIGFIVLRVLGRLIGTRIGGRLTGVPAPVRNWMGVAMLPQAGVPLGMALIAAESFPELKDALLSVVLGSTVVFELVGPAATRWVLLRQGEVRRGASAP